MKYTQEGHDERKMESAQGKLSDMAATNARAQATENEISPHRIWWIAFAWKETIKI